MSNLSDSTSLENKGEQNSLWTSGVAFISGYDLSEAGLDLPAVPVIHPYNFEPQPLLQCVTLGRAQESVVGPSLEGYTIQHFLTTQQLTSSLYNDNDGYNTPTVKPHYALQPENGPGCRYNQKITLIIHEGLTLDHKAIFTGHQIVIVHDGALSPCGQEIDALANTLNDKIEKEPLNACFLTSYVVSRTDKRIIVTRHCLLPEAYIDEIRDSLKKEPSPTLGFLKQIIAKENNMPILNNAIEAFNTELAPSFLNNLQTLLAKEDGIDEIEMNDSDLEQSSQLSLRF